MVSLSAHFLRLGGIDHRRERRAATRHGAVNVPPAAERFDLRRQSQSTPQHHAPKPAYRSVPLRTKAIDLRERFRCRRVFADDG
jgi:hypothetical protein